MPSTVQTSKQFLFERYFNLITFIKPHSHFPFSHLLPSVVAWPHHFSLTIKKQLHSIYSATLTSISASYFPVSLLSWFLQYVHNASKLITMQNEYITHFQDYYSRLSSPQIHTECSGLGHQSNKINSASQAVTTNHSGSPVRTMPYTKKSCAPTLQVAKSAL